MQTLKEFSDKSSLSLFHLNTGVRAIAPEENCPWIIAPPDNCPLDDCPPDNCPPDNCTRG